uniref:Uncharacterized protein n=1 Tax=Florenciella sp. virus SA2 TaxID=3240092 RepID=A0AB39JC77_9VIRU
MKNYIDYSNNYKNKIKYDIIEKNKNIIIYSSNNLWNYYYSLNLLKHKSKSNLKYSRKIVFNYNSNDLFFNISDIHIEIDFELLGVNEYGIFIDFFNHIKDNIVLNNKTYYILCLNFQNIKKELLEVFYIFMNHNNIHFIFLTNQISFIHNNILKISIVKKLYNPPLLYENQSQQDYLNKLISIIVKKDPCLFEIREIIYNILVFNYNIYESFQLIIDKLIKQNYIEMSDLNNVMKEYTQFICKYNNNYRSIFHIESFILVLINLKNKQ